MQRESQVASAWDVAVVIGWQGGGPEVGLDSGCCGGGAADPGRSGIDTRVRRCAQLPPTCLLCCPPRTCCIERQRLSFVFISQLFHEGTF